MSFNKTPIAILTSLAIAGVSSQALAQPEEGFTLTPSIGYYNMDNKRGVDNETALSIGLGYQFNSPWAVEFVYLKADSNTLASGADVDVDQLRLDALYHLADRNGVTPYLAAGVGSTDFSSPINLDNTQLNAGGGLKYALNDSVALRADFRLLKDTEDHHLDNLTTLGLQISFGNKSTPTQEVEEVVEEAPVVAQVVEEPQVDSDGDGVFDSQDQCLSTPAGASVDATGCELDGDKDGVVDRLDQCLTTPMGVAVDAKGCALDGDNDGVADYKDQCLTTAAGAKVNELGCYETLSSTRTVSLDVQFANNSDRVETEYYAQIAEVATFLTEYPETNVVIEGHTDDRGSEAYNQQLSEKRATAIANVLMDEFDIAAERVSAIGYGESQPKVSNDTAENRNINRRVVAVVSATVEEAAQ
ncbi:OmpA family protein [Marinomonas epiphytica]